MEIHSKKKKIFKLKNGTLGFDSEGNRHLYHYYVSQAQPVKGILFDLMKGVSHTDPVGEEFSVRVMQHMRERVNKWKEETGLGFALYGTPAENLCGLQVKQFRAKYGIIDSKGNILLVEDMKLEATENPMPVYPPQSSLPHVHHGIFPDLQNNTSSSDCMYAQHEDIML